MALHVALDPLLWFRGVKLFWPTDNEWVGFWPGDPASWSPWAERFELPNEFGCFFLLFVALLFSGAARQDPRFRVTLRWWATAQYALFVIYFTLATLVTPQSEIVAKAYVIPYLICLVAACILSFKTYAPNQDTQHEIERTSGRDRTS